jgi:hypothetical protein
LPDDQDRRDIALMTDHNMTNGYKYKKGRQS